MFGTGLGTKALGKEAYDAPVLIKRLLFEQGVKHWRRYSAAFVLMAISAATTGYLAKLIGDLVDKAYENPKVPALVTGTLRQALENKSMAAIATVSLLMASLLIIRGFANYGSSIILTRIAVRIIADNQRRMYERLLNESVSYIAGWHSSEFVSRLTAGANSAAVVINVLVSAIGKDLMSLIVLVGVMVYQDPMLSFVSLVIVPPALIVLRKLIKRLRSVATHQFQIYTQSIEAMQETVQGVVIVKAFTLERYMRERLERIISSFQHEAFKQARLANRSGPLMDTLGGLAIASGCLYGGYRVVIEGAQPGPLISFIVAFLLAYEPAKRLARLNLDIISNLAGVRALFEVIDHPPSERIEDGKPPLVLNQARIEFNDVYFAYRRGDPVLNGMSFVAAPTKFTALVGPSGGGKSTIFNLLLHFYEAEHGAITIDGRNIADVSRQSLRQQIAYVGQNVLLFRGTVRDNIALGKVGASEAEIVAAATAAHAHDFITAFPLGYDTPVGEHGLQLSGGQRQRIAIARALIKNAPIILLDEATAALDSESERHVQDAVTELCRGRTTLVIAHRLSTIMHADTIMVVEAGRISEQGRHEDLLRGGGRYASFYRLQLQQHHTELVPAAE
jgi:ATP-binding cassette subfamily B protein